MTTSSDNDRVGDLIAARRAKKRDGIKRSDSDRPAPLSKVQLSLWTMALMGGDYVHGSRPLAVRLRGPLDQGALQAALHQLVQRHEPLRTIYPLAGDEPVQEVQASLSFDLGVVDVSEEPDAVREAAVRDVVNAARRVSVDLTKEVAFVPTLIVEGPTSHVLVIALHHVCFDGWSQAVFEDDLVEIYRAIVAGDEPTLPHLPVRFQDAARWERAQEHKADRTAAVAYWRDALGGIGDGPELPDAPEGEDQANALAAFLLSAEQMLMLRRVARDEATTPFVVLLALTELAARDFFGAEDFLTQCPFAGRDRPEVQDLIGCFINHLNIRSSLGPKDLTYRGHVQAVRARVSNALVHRDVPAREVAEQFDGWQRRPHTSRLFLQWRDFPRRTPSPLSPITVERLTVPDRTSGLSISVIPEGDQGTVEISYCRRTVTEGEVEAFFARLCTHLNVLASAPDKPVGQPISIVGRAESAMPDQLFEPAVVAIGRQATLWPELPAVRAAEGELGYEALWQRSGSVGAALIRHGVVPGDQVAVCGPQTPGYLVALLGVWRVGAVAVVETPASPASTWVLAPDMVQILVGSESWPSAVNACDRSPERAIAVDDLGLGTPDDPMKRMLYGSGDGQAVVDGSLGETWSGSHQEIMRLVTWQRNRCGVKPGTVVAVASRLSRGTALPSLLLPLVSGATLVLDDPARPASLLPSHQPHILMVNRSAAAWLADTVQSGGLAGLVWTVFETASAADDVTDSWDRIAPNTRVLVVEDEGSRPPQGGTGAVVLTERVSGEHSQQASLGYRIDPVLVWPQGDDSPAAGWPQLSYAQERLWVVEQTNPGASNYLVHFGEEIEGPLDLDALNRSLSTIYARHEALRHRVVVERGSPELRIDPASALPLDFHDLTGLPPDQRDARCSELTASFVSSPFDLAAEPLMRAHLVRVDADHWVLYLVFHHLVIDGGSSTRIYEELGACYRAFSAGDRPSLEPLSGTYSEYAAHQRRRVAADGYAEDLKYWKDRLAAPLPHVQLGSPVPGGDQNTAVAAHIALSDQTAQQIEAASSAVGITPYMFGLRALWRLIVRTTGQRDFVVSMVATEHEWAPAESTVGYFVNTVPVRLSCDQGDIGPSQVRQAVLGAFVHSDAPLDLILAQEGLGGADAERLIGALDFDLVDDVERSLDFGPELRTAPVRHDTPTPKFDLAVVIRLREGSSRIRLAGRGSLFEKRDLEELAKRYEAEIVEMLRDEPADATSASHAQVLRPTPDQVSEPSGLLLLDRLLQRAQQRPNETVLETSERAVSAAQFIETVKSFAAQLAEAGVGPGDRIALDAHRSAETIAAMYATWWLGAAYVPIDASAPPRRNDLMISDARVVCYVTARNDVSVSAVSTVRLRLDHEASHPELARITQATPAYIIYTSGTSGTPKGVEVGHGAVAAFVEGAWLAYGLGPGDRVLQFHSLAFDASVEEVHMPLALGGVSVLRPEALLGSARRILEYVAKKSIVQLSLPTALWHEFVPQISASTDIPGKLRNVVIGGEAARPDVVREWHRVLAGRRGPRLFNAYGPTEATVAALIAELLPADTSDPVPIGHPLNQLRVRVGDAEGHDVAVGDWGELLLAGPQLALGYLHNPIATHAAFVELDGQRWYRTGDRARQRTDGQFEVSGRLDNQVKIDGHRIEIDEVERALNGLPAVASAAVVPFEEAGVTQLEAHVVPARDIETREIRRQLAAALPQAMIPKHITKKTQLPTNVNGKIDRTRLRSSENDAAAAADVAVDAGVGLAPDVVARLKALWEEVLEVAIEDSDADFFELGGRSLSAVRMTYLVEEQFGVELSVATVFEDPSLQSLAALISGLQAPEQTRAELLSHTDADPPADVGVDADAAADVSADVAVDAGVGLASDVVARLKALWEEVLEVAIEGSDADFFELGGRSLSAVRMTYLVEEQFGVELSVATVFEDPSLQSLAALISGLQAPEHPEASDDTGGPPAPLPVEQRETEPDESKAEPKTLPPQDGVRAAGSPVEQAIDTVVDDIPAAPVEQPLAADPPTRQADQPISARAAWPAAPVRLHLDQAPLSVGQERLWLHSQLRSDDIPYLIPARWRIRGPLQVPALRRALQLLVQRHEALRTRIVVGSQGKPRQVIDPPGASTTLLDTVDLSTTHPLQRHAEALELSHAVAAHPIDVAHEQPIRALLVQCDETDHYLTIVVHHLAADADSFNVLVAELGDFYQRCVAGHDVVSDQPNLQYSDFAVWQRARIQSGLFGDSVDHWVKTLGPNPKAIDIPGRRPNGSPSGDICTAEVDLPAGASRQLIELINKLGVSPFQLTVALAAMLFQRLSDDEITVIGTPRSERSAPGLAEIVGLFVSTMMLPVPKDGAANFAQLLKQVRSSTGAAMSHADVPVDTVLDHLGVPHAGGRLPLISVMCQYHDRSADSSLEIDGLETTTVPDRPASSGTVADLMVHGVMDQSGRYSLEFCFDQDVLEPWVVDQLARSLGQMVAQVLNQPHLPLAELELLSADELAWQLANGGVDIRPFPQTQRVEQTVEAVARKHPHNVAVSDSTRAITYAELEIEATELAHRLIRLGVREGSAVAIRLDRSVELVVAMLGVLKAKAVYLPMDSASPTERSATVLRAAGASAIISAEGRFLHIETLNGVTPAMPNAEGEAAYVMFTSGSTGVPKGVVVPHHAIQRLVSDMDYAPISQDSVVAMASNPAFDALTFEVWGALVNGARIQVLDTDTLARPVAFAEALKEASVSTMFLTSSLANVVAAEVPGAFADLDTLIVGGEALDPDSIRRIKQHGPRRLVNGYGPTECTTFSACYLIEDVAPDAVSIPIGFPVSNTGLHVLDAQGMVLPEGIPGELFVSGPGLALGYLGDEELTESRFVTCQLEGKPVRMYKTGDRVRRLASGALEYLGRMDHQIKLRGFRIELGEIESALVSQDSVLGAVALVVGEGAARRLAVFAACPGGADAAELKRELRQRVPSYMVPDTVTVLESLPLTSSGKADRQKLVTMALDRNTPETQAPDAALDPKLARMLVLWAEVLGIDELGPDEDFFESGGNSLLAIELLTRVEQEFGHEVRLSALFGARTATELLALVDRTPKRSDTSPYVVQLRPSSLDAPPPLWLIHPAGGSLVLYEPMVSHLGDSFAVYGVEAPGADGAEPPLESIHALAQHQIRAIRTVQPEGPYRILGYSVGGILGIEMARSLMALGERVEWLGAIEAGLPAGSQEEINRVKKYTSLLRGRDVQGVAQELLGSVRRRRDLAALAANERGTLAANHRRVAEAMARAFHTYAPTPLDIPLVLFFGDETEAEVARALTERWSQVATGGVSVVEVGGTHDNDDALREPHAKTLALAVQSELDRLERP